MVTESGLYQRPLEQPNKAKAGKADSHRPENRETEMENSDASEEGGYAHGEAKDREYDPGEHA